MINMIQFHLIFSSMVINTVSAISVNEELYNKFNEFRKKLKSKNNLINQSINNK